jgi:hypothetical protein
MVSDDDAIPVVVISVDVSGCTSVGGYVVFCLSVDICGCEVVTSVDAVEVIEFKVDV